MGAGEGYNIQDYLFSRSKKGVLEGCVITMRCLQVFSGTVVPSAPVPQGITEV